MNIQESIVPQVVKNRFEYDGKVSKIYRIWLVKLLLSVLTLGIYSFWGKTKIRRYIASSFQLAGDRFEYKGTGGELFRGFLKVIPILILLNIFSSAIGLAKIVWDFLTLILIFYLVFVGLYAALRYRLSRTIWRGIRGRLVGSAWKFAAKQMLYIILVFVSFGLLIPVTQVRSYRDIIENAYFGDAKFQFDGRLNVLFLMNIVTLLLLLPTVGLSRFWYHAALIRYMYAHTTINNLRFKVTHTGGTLARLIVLNLLIFIFTLGLGLPIMTQRRMKYLAKHVYIVGDIDTHNIAQSDEKLGNSGEGLDQAFSSDIGIF